MALLGEGFESDHGKGVFDAGHCLDAFSNEMAGILAVIQIAFE